MIIFILSFFVFLILIVYFFSNLGKVFNVWDAIFSWNRWAVDWSTNQLPVLTYEYPQLLPANWSLSYVIIQNTDVQAFAKAIMPLFSIFTTLLFFDLAKKKNNLAYFMGLIIYGLILYSLYRQFITSGYVDIAVSFFAFLSFYVYVYNKKEEFGIQNIILITIFACAAAITKQSGLIVLLFATVYDIWYLYKNKKQLSKKVFLKVIILLIFIILIVVFLWYLIKEIQIVSGVDLSSIKYCIHDIYKGDNLIQRLNNVIQKYFISRSIPERIISIFMSFFLLLGLFKKESRWILIIFIYPFILIWCFFFSYDHRNLAVLLPFLAYSSAFGINFFIEKVYKIWPGLKKIMNFKLMYNFEKESFYVNFRKYNIFLTIIAIFLVLILSFTINDNSIIEQQLSLQRQLGYPALNDLIYKYKNEKGIEGQIITDYWHLGLLPEFKDSSRRIAFPGVDCNSNVLAIFYDNDPFDKISSDTNYLLLSNRLSEEILEKINKKIIDGEYNLIFEFEEYVLEDNRLEEYKFIKIRK